MLPLLQAVSEELFLQCICEQFAWCEPCCLSVALVIAQEVWKRRGEREGAYKRRCRAEMKEGCRSMEMTTLGISLNLVIWIGWWTQCQSDSILLDTSQEIQPSTIS